MMRAIAGHLLGRMPANARGTAQNAGLECDEKRDSESNCACQSTHRRSIHLIPSVAEVATLSWKNVYIKQDGMTMLLVEQFAKTALEVADHAYVMEGGKIAIDGPPEELRKNERVLAAYLG